MNPFKAACRLIIGIVAIGLAQAEEKPLVLYTENFGGFSYSTRGEPYEHSREWISGTAVSFVQDLLRLSDTEYRLKLRQWAVGYERARERANTAVFSAVKPTQQDDGFYWIGPIARDEWALYTRRGNPLTITSLDDLRTLRVGGYRDSASSEYLRLQGIEVSELENDRVNPWRLKHDLIDVWVTSTHNAYKLAFEEGHPDIMEAMRFRTVDLYLALNRQTDPAIAQSLDEAYRSMIIKGRRWF